MTRPTITAAALTPSGLHLTLSTGAALDVPSTAPAFLTGAPPYVLTLGTGPTAQVLDVPAALMGEVAAALGLNPPTLSAVHIEAHRVTLQGREPDGTPHACTLPRPLTITRRAQVLGPDVLTVYTLPPLAPQRLTYHAHPNTREGQAVLLGLGWAGPFPAPDGEHLAGYVHGQPVSEGEALHLAALPEFPEVWVIVPSPAGDALALKWGDACTLDELTRAADWNAQQLAQLAAQDTPRGQA